MEHGAWGEGPTGNSGKRRAESIKKKAESVKWKERQVREYKL